MIQDANLLFAYGTLRRGARGAPQGVAEAFRRHAAYLGRARTQGRLYQMRGYAALVRSVSAADAVIGDVYRIEETLWPVLDAYEGDDYLRTRINATLDAGDVVSAFAYLNRDPEGLGARIVSGDFLA